MDSKITRIGSEKPIPSHSNGTTEATDNNDLTLTTELTFDLLKQFSWFGSACIGAVALLVQLNAIALNGFIFAALGCFGLAVLIAFMGKNTIIEALLQGKTIKDIKLTVTLHRVLSMFLIGLGAGMLGGEIYFSL
ncbi:hypothetical protein ACFSJY_15230 [Thalassotalea euphylliae]|uniref:hypothetical protein n=1 Tax=Thalassotalea euphylliae TaxID=1655234 RepID=UPI003644B74B